MEELKTITKLAWRNVWRNKRRTVLTFLTIVVGCAMIIFLNAFAKGGHDRMIEDAVADNTGHLQIHEKGYWEKQTIDYAFQPSKELLDGLDKNKRISGYTTRIQAGGLLSSGDNTSPAIIQGIDPEKEKSVTVLHKKVMEGGHYLVPSDKNKIVIGKILAKNLGLESGKSVAMISQGFDGSIAAENLEVVGLLETGNPEYDRMLVLMPISGAVDSFTMMDYVHSIAIKVKDSSETFNVKASISNFIDTEREEIMAWDELMPELVQFIVMDDIGAYIFDFVLFIVVAFGILNTIQMSVFERTREFGIMLAIGTSPRRVTRMVLMETVFITIIGTAMGILLGYLISYYYMINPIDASEYSKEIAVWGVTSTTLPTDVSALNITVTAVLTFTLSIIFSIFPARRAGRLEPVRAIRHL